MNSDVKNSSNVYFEAYSTIVDSSDQNASEKDSPNGTLEQAKEIYSANYSPIGGPDGYFDLPTSEAYEKLMNTDTSDAKFNYDYFHHTSLIENNPIMIEEMVNHLNTSHFDSLVASYEIQIEKFQEIIRGIAEITERLLENWQGRGREAFEVDAVQIQLNLRDIAEIMYNLREALIEAHADYVQYDLSLAKALEI